MRLLIKDCEIYFIIIKDYVKLTRTDVFPTLHSKIPPPRSLDYIKVEYHL